MPCTSLQHGRSPLYGGAIGGHLSVVRLLADRGADLNATGNVSHAMKCCGTLGAEAMVEALMALVLERLRSEKRRLQKCSAQTPCLACFDGAMTGWRGLRKCVNPPGRIEPPPGCSPPRALGCCPAASGAWRRAEYQVHGQPAKSTLLLIQEQR